MPLLPLATMLDFRPRARRIEQPRVESARVSPVAPRPAYTTAWARHQDDVRAAQRLRHDVFVKEMGARTAPMAGVPDRHDADLFDDFCEHLLVLSHETTTGRPEVVGTYRVLTPAAARRAGGWYTDTEFDLTRLRQWRDQMAELGRSCVHPDHRGGAVILMLWSALADFLERNGLHHVIGCASVEMHDGGHRAASLWEKLRRTHLAPIDMHVRPRLPLPVDELDTTLAADPPALIRGYLRCGAKVLGPPAWDPDFNVADLPLWLQTRDLPDRYRRSQTGMPAAR